MKRLLQIVVFVGLVTALIVGKRDFLEAQISSLKHMWSDLTGVSQLKSENDELSGKMEHEKEARRSAEADRDKLEDALKKLDKEFTEYKDKYKTGMRAKAPGTEIKDFVFRKKQYPKVVIVSISDEALTLSHEGGIIRADRAELPAETLALYAIDLHTPVQAGILPLLGSVSSHKVEQKENDLRSESGSVAPVTKPDVDVLKSVATIIVERPEGKATGSGFLLTQEGRTYFYSNAHVLATGPNPKVYFTGGQQITLPDTLEISDESEADDLVRFEVSAPEGVPPLKMSTSADDSKVDKKIVALGNSGGAGVFPILRGKIKALGPYAIEIDADVIKGNSGGPIVLDGTGVVAGVATRYEIPNVKDKGIGGTSFNHLRRICLRPDRVAHWRPFTISKLVEEDKLITRAVADSYIFSILLKNTRFSSEGVEGLDPIMLRHMSSSTVGPALSVLVRNTWREIERGGKTMTLAQRKRVLENFHIEVQKLYGMEITGVDPGRLSRFHAAVFKEVARERDDLTKELEFHFGDLMEKFGKA